MKEEAMKEAQKITDESEAESSEDISEIKFNIKDYNDLFSDFDARPFSQRGLSEDFLTEAKRAVATKETEKLNFIFLIPKHERKLRDETIIKDRIKKHFKKHFSMLEGDKKKVLRKGILFTLSGVILMFIATYLLFKFQSQDLLTSFLTVLLEPAGWFLFWEGLDLIIFESKKTDPNIEFNRRMASAKIMFMAI